MISSETAGSNGPNYGEMVFGWSPFRIISDNPNSKHQYVDGFSKPKKKEPCPPKKMAAIAKNIRFAKINLKIISSEIAGPVGPKLL